MLYFTGDIHSDILRRIYNFRRLGVKRDEADALIVAGDFGLPWSRHDHAKEQRVLDVAEKHLNLYNVTLYFVDGNHENFDMLYEIPIEDDGTRHLRPHIRHMPRGTLHKINGCDVFAFGGALSTDRGMEVLGRGYWQQELPTDPEKQQGLETLKASQNVDFVVSHAAPGGAILMMSDAAIRFEPARLKDPMIDVLEGYRLIFEERFPHAHWYYGHYHENITFSPIKHHSNLTYTCIYEEIEAVREQDVFLERQKPRKVIPQQRVDPVASIKVGPVDSIDSSRHRRHRRFERRL